MDPSALSDEQKEYLAGFTVGSGLASVATIFTQSNQPGSFAPAGAAGTAAVGPDRLLLDAQERARSSGKKLTGEETAKGKLHPLDRWSEITDRADRRVFPKGVDVFLTKSYGLFYVAPAQDSFMCRLRLPGGAITSAQLAGLADVAEQFAGGYVHVTTRANLQLREIPVDAPAEIVTRINDLGIATRGAGADNLRNITASPTAGFDPQEYFDAFPLARALHHYILNHREMYHLPRKFNISFDGGGVVTTLADTNDIGFVAVKIEPAQAAASIEAGVYFRVQLAGITGHKQFAADVGWLITPHECIEVAAAIVRVFIAHGDRTDRKKARLKYLIDAWGVEKFLAEVKKELKFTPIELPLDKCTAPLEPTPGSHLGFHAQSQPGKCYVGVVTPVGRIESDQMRALADIAGRYGDGSLRLTCWQNVLIPHIDEANVDAVKRDLQACGLDWQPHTIRAGLVACTGNAGCKFAASDTKRHALAIAAHVEQFVQLDQPVNIHVTGCHNSCAQHYIGDIGLIGAKVSPPVFNIGEPNATDDGDADDAEEVEGYHIFIGGGFGEKQGIGREFQANVPAGDVPTIIQKVLQSYLLHRHGDERFVDFTRRMEINQLRALCDLPVNENP